MMDFENQVWSVYSNNHTFSQTIAVKLAAKWVLIKKSNFLKLQLDICSILLNPMFYFQQFRVKNSEINAMKQISKKK